MVSPPVPNAFPPEPPDPDTLPPPPPAEWESLGPKDSEGSSGGIETAEVPKPQPEASIAPPPPPAEEVPLSVWPDPSEGELAKPEVEIWREASEMPQIPPRISNRLAQTYVTGTEPVWLRVQFDPQAAGKTVFVKPARGVTLDPPLATLTVSSTGECLVMANLAEGVARSHVIFYCESVKTVLPLVRAPLATVIAAEEETGGGH